jgi:hypothetical protein
MIADAARVIPKQVPE